MPATTGFRDLPTRIAIALIGGLLVLRLGLVVASPLELYADEAQYWRWSTQLDWGYYSKPPMIAWVIRLATSLFGDSEWAIRILTPVLHTVAAIFLFLLSRQMFGPRAALLTVAGYLMMPGIILSSIIISTDGVLFPFWCIALYLFWQMREGRLGWAGTVGLGAAIGIGFLSKYAMLYFFIGMALSALLDEPTRKGLLSGKGLVVLLVALGVLAPHLAWNAAHDFETVGHTVDNANLGGELFNLENLPKYLGDQMGVFGPVSFLTLLTGLTLARRRPEAVARIENWLACFIVPVLIIIGVQAVLSRAHANWAATAYPAACILVASIFARINTTRQTWLVIAAILFLVTQIAPEFNTPIRIGIGLAVAAGLILLGLLFQWRAEGLFWAGLSLHLALAAVFGTVSLGPPTWSAALGMDNTFKRSRGWQALSDQLVARAEEVRPSAVLVDEREIWHGLDYYTRGRLDAPLILWRYNAGAENFAEAAALTPDLDDNVLVASYRANRRLQIAADFVDFKPDDGPTKSISVDLGQRGNGCALVRELRLYRAHTFVPLERNDDWIARFKTTNAKGEPVNMTLDASPPCERR